MFKRILVLILSVVVASFMLVGCSLFTYDTERDLKQVVATVKSYTIYNSVTTTQVNTATGEEEEVTDIKEYTTPAKTIYKRDLVDYVNNNSSSLSSSFGSDLEGLYKYAARMLISIELVTNEVDALIDCGKIDWGVKQQNEVKKSIYSIIDNTVVSIKNTILSERDAEELLVNDGTEPSKDTTYPVKPEEEDKITDEDIGYKPEPEAVWQPDEAKYPGLTGDLEERSLDREAMRRFLALLKSRVKDDFRIKGKERAAIDKEIKEWDKVIDTEGIEYVYPKLGTYPVTDASPFGHILYYLSGKSLERSQKISELQDYLTDSVSVPDAQVAESFTAKLNEQKSRYTANVSTFETAVSGGSDPVLYYPNNNYFYVKHILLPFSDDQKDSLTAYKTAPEIANLSQKEQDEKVEAYRALLAESITCYPHKDGEDDLSKPMSVDDVLQHIKSVMLPLEADVTAADTAFDDLVYLYNTDPGAFGNNKGYVVKYKLNDGESETYMQEFADAARYMRDNLAVGQVYYEKVITDYGVHIMYFASTTHQGEVGLEDYTTPGKQQKYYDLISEPIRSALENTAYSNWENNVLSYNYNKYSKIITDNFSNLWKK